MKMDEVTDAKKEITTSFDFGREESIEEGEWVKSGFESNGEIPNILNISMELIDGETESFSINIEDELSLTE